jgi:DNA primase
MRSIQHWFGEPQTPLSLSSSTNTDNAKNREMAKFRNALTCLEEFRNGDMKVDNFVKNIWDRYSAKKAKFNRSYQNEIVPINSGVVINSNDYPSDVPVLQRLIILEFMVNKRTQEDNNRLTEFKIFQEEGLTALTKELLQHRELVKAKIRTQYSESYRDIRNLFEGLECVDRMFANVTVLDTVFQILSPVLTFPFTRQELHSHLRGQMQKQSAKLNSGSEVQRWWEIFQVMASRNEITEDVHFKFAGNDLFLRYTEVYALYMETHRKIYNKTGMDKQTLLDKLKASIAYRGYSQSQRFKGLDNKVLGAFYFDYEKTGCVLTMFSPDAVLPLKTENQDDILKTREAPW